MNPREGTTLAHLDLAAIAITLPFLVARGCKRPRNLTMTLDPRQFRLLGPYDSTSTMTGDVMPLKLITRVMKQLLS